MVLDDVSHWGIDSRTIDLAYTVRCQVGVGVGADTGVSLGRGVGAGGGAGIGGGVLLLGWWEIVTRKEGGGEREMYRL